MGVVNRSRSYYINAEWPKPKEIIETSDGGYAVCGYPLSGMLDGFLLRLDDQENTLWTTLFNTQRTECLVEIADTGFVVGGCKSADGSLTWVSAEGIEGQTLQYEGGQAVLGIVSTSAGYTLSLWGGNLVGVDAAGSVEWCYNTSSYISAYYDVCLAGNGDIVAVGINLEDDYSVLTRLNPENGSLVWERSYPDCELIHLTATADGGYAMVGVCRQVPVPPYDDIILIKVDSEGYCPSLGIEDDITHSDIIGLQVCPNPCAGSTDVRFQLSEPAGVQLSLYDISGRQVDYEPNQTLAAGIQSIGFQNLDTGIYFVRLTVDGYLYTHRFAVVSD
jgi:hypothetical protein